MQVDPPADGNVDERTPSSVRVRAAESDVDDAELERVDGPVRQARVQVGAFLERHVVSCATER